MNLYEMITNIVFAILSVGGLCFIFWVTNKKL